METFGLGQLNPLDHVLFLISIQIKLTHTIDVTIEQLFCNLPFKLSETWGVSKSLSKRVWVDFQLCDLKEKFYIWIHTYLVPTRIFYSCCSSSSLIDKLMFGFSGILGPGGHVYKFGVDQPSPTSGTLFLRECSLFIYLFLFVSLFVNCHRNLPYHEVIPRKKWTNNAI